MYNVWLLDSHLYGVAGLLNDLPFEDFAQEYYRVSRKSKYSIDESKLEKYEQWLEEQSMFVRLDNSRSPLTSADPEERYFVETEYGVERAFKRKWAVDLVSEKDPTSIDWNRACDLIERLTPLLKTAEPFEVDDWEK